MLCSRGWVGDSWERGGVVGIQVAPPDRATGYSLSVMHVMTRHGTGTLVHWYTGTLTEAKVASGDRRCNRREMAPRIDSNNPIEVMATDSRAWRTVQTQVLVLLHLSSLRVLSWYRHSPLATRHSRFAKLSRGQWRAVPCHIVLVMR